MSRLPNKQPVLLTAALCLLVLLTAAARTPRIYSLRVFYQKTGEAILEQPVQPGDEVSVRLTHSFERDRKSVV